jgi:aspartyl-tRNA synthetase
MMSELEGKVEGVRLDEESVRFGTIETGFTSIPHGAELVRMEDLEPSAYLGKRVTVRARLHNVRGTAKNAFLILRTRHLALQAVFFVGGLVNKEMVKFAATIPKESIVDVSGELVPSQVKSDLITFKTCELKADSIWVVSAAGPLPFQIDDAARAEEATQLEEGENILPRVNLDTRLNNRVVDLRTPANQAIFRLQASITTLAREYLHENKFVEIHTPKLISAASEGGANVFKVQYFKSDAFLAQSPQFYKQMAICADFDRVYEVGPVFRAENSFTHRHMTEFTGVDLEMTFAADYHEVVHVLSKLMMFIFAELPKRYAQEIATIKAQYPCPEFQFASEPLILEYSTGVAMLRAAGVEMEDYEDLSTEKERRLGQLVKDKYNTDFYVLDKYPLAVRPFYTMPDSARPGYSNSYDVFMRGEEIMSGAQRVHDPKLLEERARAHGVDMKTIEGYLDAFKYGVPPHAGGGIGLERVVMLYLGLGNIRKSSMFPRDPHRITP